MTEEGIIQKVFKDFILNVKHIDRINADEIVDLETQLIKEIQQELIQADTFYCKDPMVSEFIHRLNKKLMGETKE